MENGTEHRAGSTSRAGDALLPCSPLPSLGHRAGQLRPRRPDTHGLVLAQNELHLTGAVGWGRGGTGGGWSRAGFPQGPADTYPRGHGQGQRQQQQRREEEDGEGAVPQQGPQARRGHGLRGDTVRAPAGAAPAAAALSTGREGPGRGRHGPPAPRGPPRAAAGPGPGGNEPSREPRPRSGPPSLRVLRAGPEPPPLGPAPCGACAAPPRRERGSGSVSAPAPAGERRENVLPVHRAHRKVSANTGSHISAGTER